MILLNLHKLVFDSNNCSGENVQMQGLVLVFVGRLFDKNQTKIAHQTLVLSIASAISQGSDEPAYPHSLASASSAIMETQTKR